MNVFVYDVLFTLVIPTPITKTLDLLDMLEFDWIV